MAIALRRFGGGMAAWVTGCVIVAGVLVLWDAATCLWFFDGLLRLDIQAAQHPGFGAGVFRAVLGLFFPSAIWPIWAATIGASVAALSWVKVRSYRVAALFGIGFGPALATILEGGSPVSGKPLALLIPVWFLVIVADIFLTCCSAWFAVALPKRAAMSIRTARELCKETERLVIAAGAVVIFAAGWLVGGDYCRDVIEKYRRQALFNQTLARMNLLEQAARDIPELVRGTIRNELSRYGWGGFLGGPL